MMKEKQSYTGLNIQWPISNLIISGKKTIETRTYPIPQKYLNKELAMVETPGKMGKFKARVIAIIKITDCFKYKNKSQFYKDIHRHHVTPDSHWAWEDKPKWGWEIEIVRSISPSILCKTKGIIYRKKILL